MGLAAPAGLLHLELTAPPQATARLWRAADLVRLRLGRVRATSLRLVWHDTPTGDLAASGLVLCEQLSGRDTTWRLERLPGAGTTTLAPGTPLPLYAEASDPSELGHPMPAPLLALAAWEGTRRAPPQGEADASVHVEVREGALRAVAGDRACCRICLSGPAATVAPLALALAAQFALAVPPHALAVEAHALAGHAVPQTLGPPALPTGEPVDAAFAHIAGHLAGVLLHWAALSDIGAGPEPVHQMRVAVRRLRSAIAVFRRAVGGADLEATADDLRALMRVLGPARDWDVFCAGTGRAVADAFDGDRVVARMLAAAERRRIEGYATVAAYLDSAAFRDTGIRLACLAAGRPWQRRAAPPPDDAGGREAADRQAATLAMPLPDFAEHALTRRLARLTEAGEDIARLPAEELHRVRILAKRLRYAAEFFAPLYPARGTRRYIGRVAALQERLGHLNDGAVADALMAQLGASARGHAAGVVRGYVAAGQRGGRAKAERSWRKLRRAEPFWS